MSPLKMQGLALVLGLTMVSAADAQRDTSCHEREPTGSAVRITSPDEPGTPLIITGRVLSGSERTPVAGARVLAFHTDSEGYYSVGGMEERNARLCGVLGTDDEGGFRIETIQPAHYATGGPPAHVHFEVTVPGERMRRFSLNFEGDPLLDGRLGGETWSTIRPIVQKDDALWVERDLWIR